MTKRNRKTLDRWLSAERAESREGIGESEELMAERALRELFQILPGIDPAEGFAAAVLGRLEGRPVAAAKAHWFPWAAVVGLMVSGIVFLQAVSGAKVLWRGFGDPGAASMVAEAASAFGTWLASSIRIWELLSLLGGALAQVAQTPQVVSALAMALLLSMIAFRRLNELARNERSWSHVESV